MRKFSQHLGAIYLCTLILVTTVSADTVPPTVSILSPADGMTINTDGLSSYPVKITFRAWDKADEIKTIGANSFVLNWWKGGSNGSIDITSFLSSWGPSDTLSTVFRTYGFEPGAGSGDYTIQIQATDKANNVGTSRKVDITVRIAPLNNYSGFAGDGKLLVRDNDNTICMSCHALKAHSSADVESTKYGNWERVCRDCHTPHNTKNIFLLASSFKVYTGANQTFAYRKKVDFRNMSGESVYGFVSGSGNERRGPCQVCHTRTSNYDDTPRWRNYTSEEDIDGVKHNAGLECTLCHLHTEGFLPGESKGDLPCSGCHSDFFFIMNGTSGGYHHYLNNANVTELASASKYPVKAQPNLMGGQSDENRRCLMCHVDHNIFRPDINSQSPGRAYNLRPSISVTPGATSGQNTDFVQSETYGGICLSCHRTSQSKSYDRPDSTTNTMPIRKAQFEGSPHNFTVPATFTSDGSTFNANCSKCHVDNLPKKKQNSTYRFGLHFGNVAKYQGSMPNNNNTGTVAFASVSSITDTTKMWDDNVWQYERIYILQGTGTGQVNNIRRNTNDTLYVAPIWLTQPDATSIYIIGLSRDSEIGKSTGGNTGTTLNDTGKAWISNFWQNRPIRITGGTGLGEVREIVSNTATGVTVSPAWGTTPDSTSEYSIGDPAEEELCFRCHSETTNPNAANNTDYYGVQTFESAKTVQMEGMFVGYGQEGRSTGGNTVNTLNDTTRNWDVDQWAGMPIKIVAGSGRRRWSRKSRKGVWGGGGQTEVARSVVSNTATQMVVTPDWTSTPGSNSRYYVGAGNPYRHRIYRYFAKHRSDEVVNAPATATAKGWFNMTSVTDGLHTGCQDCHNPHANRKPGDDYGTAESGTLTSLTDNDKTWAQDQWRGYILRIQNGTGLGQDRLILSNSATTLNVGAAFDGVSSIPASDSYYVLQPYGHPERGNNLWNPNSGAWGISADYAYAPTLGNYTNPIFSKVTSLTGGTDKIYQLCFKCHSDYGWGLGGTPFTIPDTPAAAVLDFEENETSNIAKEFNPDNLGHHPVVDKGNNQPILNIGSSTDGVGPYTSGSNHQSYIGYNNSWSAGQYTGYCVEITSGTLTGQIRAIEYHTSTRIYVDPNFGSTPPGGSQFAVRKCSIYNNGANYSGRGATPWPRFTRGTITISNGSPTATITGLNNGIPSTVLNGWYLYAGTLYTNSNTNVMPNVGKCSATAPCPPMFATSGWFQISGISGGASEAGTTSVTLTLSPTPTSSYSGSYAISAGLGNTFVPPYGPWSKMGCADCHDGDDPEGPSGPHGSSSQWILRTLEAQTFPWFYGGLNSTTSTTDATLVQTVGYPDGNTTWTGASGAMVNYMCLNCHRADVYGYEDRDPGGDSAPTGTGFTNFGWKYMSRLPHLPDDTGWGSAKDSDNGGGWGGSYTNTYGIMCMYCHGGDARATKSAGTNFRALGGIHGSNLGLGANGSSYRGRRLLNGAAWTGVTRATTKVGVLCWTANNGDGISTCDQGHGGQEGMRANYPYASGRY